MIAALLVCLSDLFYNNNNNTHFLLLVPFIGSQLPLPLLALSRGLEHITAANSTNDGMPTFHHLTPEPILSW